MATYRTKRNVYPIPRAVVKDDIFKNERKIVEDMLEVALSKKDSLAEFNKQVEREKSSNTLFKAAFLKSVEVIKDFALDLIIIEAHKACLSSNEFNYDLYVSRLTSAIQANKEKILVITPNEQSKIIVVKIDFSSLGDISEWGEAVKDAINRKISDATVRSTIWKEKIYAVDREGGKVTRKAKKKSGETVSKEVTSRYVGKYRETIEARLALIPNDKAPFWYIIEHGNADLKFESSGGGTPYPVVRPSNFIGNTEEKIAKAFEDIYNTIRGEEEKEALADLGIKEGDTFEEASRILQEKAGGLEKFTEQVDTSKRIAKIQVVEGTFEVYKHQVSLRGAGGRFIKVPK